MGGLQALATFMANNSLPCSMSMYQICMGIILAAAVILFSKLFCAFICPLGTIQDLLSKLRKKLHIKGIKINNGSTFDKILRLIKYVLVFWIFYMTVSSSELFCKNIDPYYAVATGFKGEITLWMSIISIIIVFAGSFFIDMFWCRYICPLGAISNTLKFWVWIGVLFGVYYASTVVGADIPWSLLLGAFCLIGYLLEVLHSKPKFQVLHIVKDSMTCNNCGLCTKKCPYHIDIKSYNDSKINHVDCTLCGECVAACNTGALNIGICRPTRRRVWNIIPAFLTVGLIAFGIWAGGKIELPTIDIKWDLEQVEDNNMLKNTTIDGLRSVKCFGSSMAFKARLQKIDGVHGVKVFVKRHSADILYDSAVVTPEEIQGAIYIPSKCIIRRLEADTLDSMKVVTIRTEKMYDKMDINYLGILMKQTGRMIYGIETEFACPLIVKVYMDPTESLDKEWFKNVVEQKVLNYTTKNGEDMTIDLDYKFVKMEDESTNISSEYFLGW